MVFDYLQGKIEEAEPQSEPDEEEDIRPVKRRAKQLKEGALRVFCVTETLEVCRGVALEQIVCHLRLHLCMRDVNALVCCPTVGSSPIVNSPIVVVASVAAHSIHGHKYYDSRILQNEATAEHGAYCYVFQAQAHGRPGQH